jgi:hypothetical protein
MEHMGHSGEKRSFFASRANIVLIGFLVLAGFYLIAEHRAHLWLVLPWLPWLLLLACPLMHIFMHGGHGGHGGNDDTGRNAPGDRQAPPHQH